LIRELSRRGEIDSDGMMNSLLQKADNALMARAKGNLIPARTQLQAVIDEASAQSGQHLGARGAALLIGDVQYVSQHL
jgi:hypothetical protein